MKNILKISAFVLGSIIISNINCYAVERGGDVAEAQAVQPLPELSKEQYGAILDKLPAQNMELRLEFLQKAWDKYKDRIITDKQAKTGEQDKTDEQDKIAVDDFNKSYDDLPDKAKNIVQTWLQNHDRVWASDNGEYHTYGNNTLKTGLIKLYQCSRLQALPREWHDLFNMLYNITNGCEGCTLTFDLILDILREGLMRLQSKPGDTNVLCVFAELSKLAEEYAWEFAHNVTGLPELVIKTATEWSINREYNGEDLSLLIKILNEKIATISSNGLSTSKKQPFLDANVYISSLMNQPTFTYATRLQLEQVLASAGIALTDLSALLKELDKSRDVTDVDAAELQKQQKAFERRRNEQIEQERREIQQQIEQERRKIQQQIEQQRRDANSTPVIRIRAGLKK